jgi:hypothetical protein
LPRSTPSSSGSFAGDPDWRVLLKTDFERFGLSGEPLRVEGRVWLLTVDFEAFGRYPIGDWIPAMRRCASLARAGAWKLSIFLATEDVVALRARGGKVYADFLEAAGALHEAGARFYAHNHCVFDLETGESRDPSPDPPQRIEGYARRASLYYDAVHKHSVDLADWLVRIRDVHESFLDEAGIPRPRRAAFRAGGWDHGSTPAEAKRYLDALRAAGFDLDSSATSGVFGTRTWRVGAPFGANAFSLPPNLVEVAPTGALDFGVPLMSRAFAGSLARHARQPSLWIPPSRPGALVSVLHFDHLFGPPSAPRDATDANKRLERFFRRLAPIRRALRLTSTTFDDLVLVPHGGWAPQAPARRPGGTSDA